MIQFAMLFALGFLAATLAALGILPLIARRSERRARARLERHMPLSMPAITAERDQLRAAHAVDVRRLEQRIEELNGRLAGLLTETGRQGTRIAMLEDAEEAAAETIAGLQSAYREASAALRDSEAERATQTLILNDIYQVAEQRRDRLAAATTRLAAAETLADDQRIVIADLEKTVAGGKSLRTTAETVPATLGGDDTIQLRAAFARLRADHEIMRKTSETLSAEREKLRFRVDELLLQIDDLQDQAEEAAEVAEANRRKLAKQEKTITTLTTRVAAREEALGTVKLLLADETARRKASDAGQGRPAAARVEAADLPPDDPAALRRAVSALAADLVRIATTARDAEARRPSMNAG